VKTCHLPLTACLALLMTAACSPPSDARDAIDVGDLAPDFSATDQDGVEITLANFRGTNVVLYFYPRDGTPGCTAQACSFRDSYEAFTDAGAEVIGVSADTLERHREFAAEHNLPFHLLSDADGTLRRLYGVPKTLGLFAGRVTYVIDTGGVVRHVFSSQLKTGKHIEEALATLQAINAPAKEEQ
jgi:peroxiredoxin Q/BCP